MTAAPSHDDRPPIVLIHGMWMTPHSWDKWIAHYAERGYDAIAPGWPGVDRTPAELRADPSALKGLGLAKIVDHYDPIVRGLDRPPIIIGHSFGGLVTQLLLNRGLGAAGVAIATAPPKGVVVLPPSTLRTAWPGLKNPLNRNGLAPLTPTQFQWRFANTLGRAESDAIYDEQYIPGSNRAFFEDASANLSRHSPAAIDFSNPSRPPLLLVVGSEDHVSPPGLNKSVLKLQRQAPSVTESKEYPGRTHFTAGMDGWEKVADDVLDWAVQHAAADSPVAAGAPPPAGSAL
jgi:non-heme chloroperoxidase